MGQQRREVFARQQPFVDDQDPPDPAYLHPTSIPHLPKAGLFERWRVLVGQSSSQELGKGVFKPVDFACTRVHAHSQFGALSCRLTQSVYSSRQVQCHEHQEKERCYLLLREQGWVLMEMFGVIQVQHRVIVDPHDHIPWPIHRRIVHTLPFLNHPEGVDTPSPPTNSTPHDKSNRVIPISLTLLFLNSQCEHA